MNGAGGKPVGGMMGPGRPMSQRAAPGLDPSGPLAGALAGPSSAGAQGGGGMMAGLPLGIMQSMQEGSFNPLMQQMLVQALMGGMK
jgi:hypothetical protein